jgi:hypothetical protein
MTTGTLCLQVATCVSSSAIERLNHGVLAHVISISVGKPPLSYLHGAVATRSAVANNTMCFPYCQLPSNLRLGVHEPGQNRSVRLSEAAVKEICKRLTYPWQTSLRHFFHDSSSGWPDSLGVAAPLNWITAKRSRPDFLILMR